MKSRHAPPSTVEEPVVAPVPVAPVPVAPVIDARVALGTAIDHGADAAIEIDAPPPDPAYDKRAAFFTDLAKKAKRSGGDCARLADVVRAATPEVRAIAGLGSAVGPDRTDADHRNLASTVKILSTTTCADNSAITKFLDELSK